MYVYLITNILNGKKYVGKCEKPVNKKLKSSIWKKID